MKWFSIFDGEKVESKLITNRQAKKAQKRVDEYNKKLEEEAHNAVACGNNPVGDIKGEW